MDPTEREPELFGLSLPQIYFYIVVFDFFTFLYGVCSTVIIMSADNIFLTVFQILYFLSITSQLLFGMVNITRRPATRSARVYKIHEFTKIIYICSYVIQDTIVYPLVCKNSDTAEKLQSICHISSLNILEMLIWLYLQSIFLRIIMNVADGYQGYNIEMTHEHFDILDTTLCEEEDTEFVETIEVQGTQLNSEELIEVAESDTEPIVSIPENRNKENNKEKSKKEVRLEQVNLMT